MSFNKRFFAARSILISLILIVSVCFGFAYSDGLLSFKGEAKTVGAIKNESVPMKRGTPAGHRQFKLNDTKKNWLKSPLAPASDERLIFGTGSVESYPNLYGLIESAEPFFGDDPLTISATNDIEPAWSPDGKQIVFISFRDGIDDVNNLDLTNREVYIMNADGTDQRRLTFNDQPESQPIFSPDGSTIIYVSRTSDENGERSGVFSMGSDGSNQTLLFDENCVYSDGRKKSAKPFGKSGRESYYPGILGIETPNFSPGGEQILFGFGYVYSFSVSNGVCSVIANTSGNAAPEPRYSPDGGSIAYVDTETVLNPDTNEYETVRYLRVLNPYGGFEQYQPSFFYSTPVWSPDGSKIAYLGGSGGFFGADQVAALDLNDGTVSQIYFPAQVQFFSGLSWALAETNPAPLDLRVIPSPQMAGGETAQGLVRFFPTDIPPEGATLNLSVVGETGVLTLPQTSIPIAPGPSGSATFDINVLPQFDYKSADIVATLGTHTARHTVSVRPGGTPKPDLKAVSFTAPEAITAGVSLPVSWTVENIGTVATTNLYLDRVYFSLDNQLDANDDRLLTQNQSALGAGEQRSNSVTTVIIANSVPQSGQYYLIFRTNDGPLVNEGDSANYANNQIVRPIQVNLPDVVAENLIVPNEVEPGVAYNFSYTIRNTGAVGTPTNDTFLNKLYFSDDNIVGNADDVLLDQYFQSPLAAGQTATRTFNNKISTVPARANGQKFFYAVIDTENRVREGTPTGAGETNNTTFKSTQFFYRVADLQIASTTAPPEVDSDTPFALNWTDLNAGNKNAAALTDKVYFSLDAQIGSDVELGSFDLSAGLAAGASANRIQNVTIPTNSLTQTGNYFVYVRTDAANVVDEGENENNNVRFQPVRVRRLLRPDLRVTNITAPNAAFFDQTISVQWTVTNSGQGPTSVPQWKDKIYLHTAQSTSVGYVAQAASVSALNPGESYTTSATFKIPRGYNGAYFFTVKTDADANLNEENTTNNTLSRSIQINVPPLPDLIVTGVQAPDELFAGQEVEINYSVKNQGTAAAGSRYDRIYFSRDTTLDLGQDRLIYTSDPAGSPGAGATNSYLARNSVPRSNPVQYTLPRVPSDMQGLWYVFVVTDIYDSVYEYTNENNNFNYDRSEPGSPINVLVAPPDLVVPQAATAPPAATSGQSIQVGFTVKNQGAFGANSHLYHAVYLSADQTFDAATDTLLGTIRDENGFAPAAEHPLTINARVPDCLANGNYYLFAVADSNKGQFEFDPNFDAETNNASPPKQIQITTVPPDLRVTNLQISPVTQPGQSVSITWTVANTGTGAASGNWIDHLVLNSTNPQIAPFFLTNVERPNALAAGASYTVSRTVGLPAYMQGEYFISVTTDFNNVVPECGTSETNNQANSVNFAVQNNLPDLVINAVGVPAAAAVGTSFNVQWSGGNANGAMPANSSSWSDFVYLSTDQNLDSGDYLIGSGISNQPLAGGQTYQKQASAATGNVPAGTYYVLIAADAINKIYEGAANSAPENNNVRASSPITLTAPAVDLQVGSVAVASPFYSGTNLTVSWTVTNYGSSATLGAAWSDYVVLSRDSIIDANDKILGYRPRNAALAGGANYTATGSFPIPNGLTGDYNIFVVTDYSNRIVESDNANNTSQPFAVNLILPPPSDLNITNVTPPTSVNLGENANFHWTVQNSGPNAVRGKWRDTVYLSRDTFWDSGDVLIGQREMDSATVSVAAGATYTADAVFNVANAEEGTYYVIVRTDAQNSIRESNEANNVSNAAAITTVTITELPLNTPFNTTLENGGQKFFKFTPAPIETLLFSLTSDQPARSNELLTNFGSLVSRADYDFQGDRPTESNQINVIPETQSGTYYTLVRTDFIPESFAADFNASPEKIKPDNGKNAATVQPQNITVKAQILPFSVRKVTPEEAGSGGYATLLVEGAKFQDGATLRLIGAGGAEIAPAKFKIYPSKILAIFDLKGTAAGNYDVVVRNPNAQTVSLDDGFKIVSGGGAVEPRVTLNGASVTRGGRTRYTFTFANDGLNDLLNVPLIITMPSQYNYQLDESNYLGNLAEFLPPGANPALVPLHIEKDGTRILMLFAPVLRSKRSVSVGVDIALPSSFSHFEVSAFTLPPLEEWYDLARSGQGNGAGEERLLRPNAGADCSEADAKLKKCLIEMIRSSLFTILQELLPTDCVGAAWRSVVGLSDLTFGLIVKGSDAGAADVVGGLGSLLASSIGGLAVACLDEVIPWLDTVSAVIAIGQLAYNLWDCFRQYECGPPPTKLGVSFPFSIDPNEKIAPEGSGAEHFVPASQPLLYRINFENLASATAPAQTIRIVDNLPPTLDPRTVRLREIGFKQTRIVLPDEQAFYQNRIQLGADLNNLKADVLAGLDLVNNRIFWTLRAVDPQTGDAPSDPLAGLLPPNNANRDGEGYVIFTVEAKPNFPNRTALNNFATIIFDQNEPIITNTTANLLDSVIPISRVAGLPATSETPNFQLNWTGSDDADGSGFKGYNILQSENGGAYISLINSSTATSAPFSGRWGKSYRFYSLGRDNAGNVEMPPDQPDATIRIRGGDTEGDVAPRPDGRDGQIAVDDLIQIRRFAAGLDTDFQYNEFQRADISPLTDGGDGALTVQDIVQARRFAAGLDEPAEAAGPNEFAAFSSKTTANDKASALPREIRPVRVSRTANKVVVALELEAQGDEVGIGTTLNFDPAVLSSPAVTLGSGASGAALTVNDLRANQGRLGILLDKAPNQPFPAGSRQFVTIEFTVIGNAPTTNFSFGNSPIFSQVVNASPSTLPTTFSAAAVSLMAPTAAAASLSGRVTANGRGVSSALVELTGESGIRRTVLTNSFGYYRFNNLASGETYVVAPRSKRYQFEPQVISLTGDIVNLDFTAQ